MHGRGRDVLAVAVLAALVLGWLPGTVSAAEPRDEKPEETICRLIGKAARASALPEAYLTRLIWRESSFRPSVTSSAGAQGIAQFMPGTAKEQGLADPFDPETAIPASAGYLASLRARFGNLGLAAAAYNAGPTRLARWREAGGFLPIETEAYVSFVTGSSVYDWAADTEHPKLRDDDKTCLTIVAALRIETPAIYEGVFAPFGVQLSGNFSKDRALASYRRVAERYPAILADHPTLILGTPAAGRGRSRFYRVRVAAETLKGAQTLCRRLEAAGGSCVVLRN